MRPSRDEIIEARMLASLALIAEANDRSLVQELNLAVKAYVHDNLPVRSSQRMGDAVGAVREEVAERAA